MSESGEVAAGEGRMVISTVVLDVHQCFSFDEVEPCTRRGNCQNPRRWQMPLQLEQPLQGDSGRQKLGRKWSELPEHFHRVLDNMVLIPAWRGSRKTVDKLDSLLKIQRVDPM